MIRSDNPDAMCGGKTCFATYDLARKIARLSSGRHAAPIVPFRCPHCGQWHNGTSNRQDKKPRFKK